MRPILLRRVFISSGGRECGRLVHLLSARIARRAAASRRYSSRRVILFSVFPHTRACVCERVYLIKPVEC